MHTLGRKEPRTWTSDVIYKDINQSEGQALESVPDTGHSRLSPGMLRYLPLTSIYVKVYNYNIMCFCVCQHTSLLWVYLRRTQGIFILVQEWSILWFEIPIDIQKAYTEKSCFYLRKVLLNQRNFLWSVEIDLFTLKKMFSNQQNFFLSKNVFLWSFIRRNFYLIQRNFSLGALNWYFSSIKNASCFITVKSNMLEIMCWTTFHLLNQKNI